MLSDTKFIEESLINGLYYLRSLREYCARIEVSFPKKYEEYIQKSYELAKRCETLGKELMKYADGNLPAFVLESEIFVTKYTLECELLTEKLFGIDINTDITKEELNIKAGTPSQTSDLKPIVSELDKLNEEQLQLAKEFIEFATTIEANIKNQELFAFYYNSLNQYIVEDMNFYVENLERLKAKNTITPTFVADYEYWGNKFLLGIVSFIRGEIDPYYQEAYNEANNFVLEYKNIVAEYQTMILTPTNQKNMTLNSLELAKRFSLFVSDLIEKILKKEIYFISAPITKDNALTAINYFIYNLRRTKEVSEEDSEK